MNAFILCCCVLWAQAQDVSVAPQGSTWLSVETEPPGAEVLVDGEPAGKTNLVLQVRPGKHELKVRLHGYSAEEVRVECPPGRLTRVRKTLRALPPQPRVTPPPAISETPPTPRAEVERLIAEAVTAYEKGDTGAAQELLSKARQVADKCTEESLRDWMMGEIAKGYSEIMDHAGAIETTLLIRRGARYCRIAYEVIALLAQQDPDIAQAVFDVLFPTFAGPGWTRVPSSVRSDVPLDQVPERAMAQKAIEEARKAHAEGRLPVRPTRPSAPVAVRPTRPEASQPASTATSPPPAPPATPPETRPEQSSATDDTFVRLFSGTDLQGWRTIGQGRWEVEDGAIVGRLDRPAPAGGFLVYDGKKFGDFVLRLKFKLPSGNSGVMIRSAEGGWAGLTGLQIDLDATDRTVTGCLHEVYADLAARSRRAVNSSLSRDLHRKVRSEWTEMTIRAEGSKITVTIAGEQTAEWKDYPGAREGLIALQLWGSTEVMFKDIEICELGSVDQTASVPEKVPSTPAVTSTGSQATPAPSENPREAVERLVRQAQEQYEKGDEGAAQESLARACAEAEKISDQRVRDWAWKKIIVDGYARIGYFDPVRELVYKIRDRETRSKTGYEVALLQAWPHQRWSDAVRTAWDLILQGGWGVGPDTEVEESRCREAVSKINELRKAWEEGRLTPPGGGRNPTQQH